MSFGSNLLFLRKMHNNMTQEDLAEIMHVSRQTISKWESDNAYPEMEKVFELCSFFSCSMDELLRKDMNVSGDAYSAVHIENVEKFKMARYAVISHDPEGDAINHMKMWAKDSGLLDVPGYELKIIGWDFPFVNQQQINVFHMHGYAAACILPEDFKIDCKSVEIASQDECKYAVITIKNYKESPFDTIPNAYKIIQSYMQVNGYNHREDDNVLPCFEYEYEKDGQDYMNVYIATEN